MDAKTIRQLKALTRQRDRELKRWEKQVNALDTKRHALLRKRDDIYERFRLKALRLK